VATTDTTTDVVPEEIAKAIILPQSYADVFNVVHPACRWLRENMPIARAELEGYDPVWMISKHAHVSEIYRNTETFHNADHNIILYPKAGDEYLRGMLNGTTRVLDNLTYMEPPEHGRYRTAISPPFLPAQVRQFNERIHELAKEAVGRLLDCDGECDFVDVISRDYPLHVVMEMLGIPPEDYELMMELTQQTFGGDDPDWKRPGVPESPEAAAISWQQSVADFYEYFEVIRKDRLAHPTDDLASAIVNARLDNGELMPEGRQNHLAASIALAGHDTTNSAIAGGVLGLARFPDQFEKVKADPSLVPGLVEESLRYATPAKHFTRNTVDAVDFHGVQFAAMDRIMTLTVSANRDEDVFPDPERFDVTRRPNPHLSFGWGPHICLGQHVAKNEMRFLFEELLPKLETLELADEPRLKIGNFVNGPKTLPIRFTKA
jgi:alpha-terpineol hydroxylase